MNLFAAGARWLDDRLRQNGRVQVNLKRAGSPTTAGVLAGVGVSVHQGEDATGGLVTFRTVDFLFTAEDYAFGGVRSDPKRNDLIESDHTGVMRSYEVVNPTGQDHWTNSDEFAHAIRVHTQVVQLNG